MRGLTFVSQESIFASDGGHDYRTECEKSGELFLLNVKPDEDPHHYALDVPFSKILVGEPSHLSAYDVRSTPLSDLLPTVFAPQFCSRFHPTRSLRVHIADTN